MKNISTHQPMPVLSSLVKTLLICSCFMLACNAVFSQLQWLNPKPAGYTNTSIVFTDHSTGYVLNLNGDLFKTTDAGNTWQAQNNYHNGVCMQIADSTGVIAGNNGALYISTDNGNTWQQVNTGITDNFSGVNIVSRDTFFLSDGTQGTVNPGNIYATANRGKTWSTLPCGQPVCSVSFVNSKLGYIGTGNGIVLKTQDGGQTWQTKKQVPFSPSAILCIQFVNSDTGYAFEQWDSLLVTTDGGNTWSAHLIGGYLIGTLDFLNGSFGYLGGQDGILYVTHDGGNTLTPIVFEGPFDGGDIMAIDFLSADTGFAVGMRGQIIKTTDGGQNWQGYSPTYLTVEALAYGTAITAYAASGNNTYKTTDMGQTWNPLSLATSTQFGSQGQFERAHFFSQDSGFITTSNPVLVHHTFDGGLTWDAVNPAPAGWSNITDMQFLDNKNGFICITGTGNTLIEETKDGGLTWNSVWQAQYSNQYFNRVFYIDESTAYAIDNNDVYKTTDSSKTWGDMYTSYYTPLSLFFINPQKGFLTTSGPTALLTTNNGGQTWANVNLPVYMEGANTVKFFNPQVGYLAGNNQYGPLDYGYILETVDSGATWQVIKNVTATAITFTPDSSVVFSGFAGAILGGKITEAHVDSLNASPLNKCTTALKAYVTAVMSQADSISFEITGSNGQVISVPAQPSAVNNKRVACTANVSTLVGDSNYVAKVKYWYNGQYVYSDTVQFAAKGGLPVPAVSTAGNVLTSSYASANQWYRNDTLINGAVLQAYTLPLPVTNMQCYTVQVTNDSGCASVSNPVCIDSLNNTQQSGLSFSFAPNPAGSGTSIKFSSLVTSATILVFDRQGKRLRSYTIASEGQTTYQLSTGNLPSGLYIVQVITSKGKSTSKLVVLQ